MSPEERADAAHEELAREGLEVLSARDDARFNEIIAAAVRAAVLEEREACAALCSPATDRPPQAGDDTTEWQIGWSEGYTDAARALRAAIRERPAP